MLAALAWNCRVEAFPTLKRSVSILIASSQPSEAFVVRRPAEMATQELPVRCWTFDRQKAFHSRQSAAVRAII